MIEIDYITDYNISNLFYRVDDYMLNNNCGVKKIVETYIII